LGLFNGFICGRVTQLGRILLYRSHQARLSDFCRDGLIWLADTINSIVRQCIRLHKRWCLPGLIETERKSHSPWWSSPEESKMDVSILPAASALAGSLIGGLSTLTAALLTQRRQFRAQALIQEATKREALYAEFI